MEGWFVLEMFGHIRHIGFVTEVEAFGGKLGRIEALQSDGTSVTTMFGAASVFRLTPVTEEKAREMVKPYEYKPLSVRTVTVCDVCGMDAFDCECSQRSNGEAETFRGGSSYGTDGDVEILGNQQLNDARSSA